MIELPAKALDLGELARRAANIVRAGTVAEIDLAAARVRARYGDSPDGGPVLTGWLPWISLAAGEDRDWRPPSIGEQVILLAPFGELSAGFALAGIYLQGFPAPEASGAKRATLYRDGARIEYDSETHALSAVLPDGGKASISAPGGLFVAGDTEIDGDLDVDGDLSVTGDISAGGDISADGSVSAKQDVSDKLGSMAEMRRAYNAHVHGVAPGFVTPPIAPTSRMS